MKAEEYLKTLTDQIRCKMAKEAVRDELLCHIEDQKAAFISEGMEQDEAEEAAVLEMGDPVETGNEMDRIHRPKMAWGMIALIAALSIVGYVVQKLIEAKVVEAGGYNWLGSKNLLFLAAGLVIMIGVCFLDYTRIGKYARKIMISVDVLVFVGITFFALMLNGAANFIWIPVIGPITIEYILLLTVPLYAGVLYSYRGQGYRAVVKGILWMILPVWLALRIPRLTTSVTLALSFVIMLVIAVWRNWFRISRKKTLAGIFAGTVIAPAMVGAYYWFFGASYQQERLRMILTRDPNESGAGYTVGVIRQLLGDSRIAGPGNLSLEASQVPVFQDFVLSGVIAYYGILAAVIFVGLLLFLLVRFLKISLGQRNQLGMLMGAGCSVLFLVEAAFYLLTNLGVIYVGTFCPFLSYGGTGTIVTYILLGLLLSIYRYQNTAPERKPVPRIFRKPV
ncbi:FtsW/RodA/SpoVE family cell cycle protein [Mediterraneibacter glycyrrhizinilyticus]|nr:FtsW/RodA/SpoVE family cell cycle protein [Mediterraneibacter glycyrrhizinilyticus]MBM6854572.1 FtsW/RodA/SpoVE family cell cycle protein [Mediterraneibacter glycyrrhizinilyticus]